MQSLPPEIWAHICKYLSKEELYSIRGLNRTLMHSALSELRVYEQAKLGRVFMNERQYSRYLEHRCLPLITPFIKSLSIHLNFSAAPNNSVVAPSLLQQLRQPFTVLRHFVGGTRSRRPPHRVTEWIPLLSHVSTFRRILNAVGCLNTITGVDLNIPDTINCEEEDVHYFLSMLWDSTCHSLRTLRLSGSRAQIARFASNIPPFPLLERFEMDINEYQDHDKEAGTRFEEGLANLLNSYSSTLKTIVLRPSCSDTSACQCFDALLMHLEEFPHLTTFTFRQLSATSQSLGSNIAIQLSSFLTRHPHTRTLEIPFHPAVSVGSALKDLVSIDLFPFHDVLELDAHLASYIRASARTLRRLSLHNDLLPSDDAMRFLRMTALSSGYLSELRIGVIALTPELLHYFSSELPHLISLHLRVNTILPSSESLFVGPNARDWKVDENFKEFMQRLDQYTFETCGIVNISIFFMKGLHEGIDLNALKDILPRLAEVSTDYEPPMCCCLT